MMQVSVLQHTCYQNSGIVKNLLDNYIDQSVYSQLLWYYSKQEIKQLDKWHDSMKLLRSKASKCKIKQAKQANTTIEDNFTAKDFSFLHQKFAETENGLTDMHSLLSAISQTAVDRDQIKQVITLLKSSENDDANMTAVSKELQTFADQSLLLALSEISSPIITLLFFILQILDSIWALVFTVKFRKKDAPKLQRAAKTAAVTRNLKRKLKRKIKAMTQQISSLRLQHLPLSKNKTILCDLSQSDPRVLLSHEFRQKAFEIVHFLNHAGIKSTNYMMKQKFLKT